MATTKIHAIKATIDKAIRYVKNPEKTDAQTLVSGYNTNPQTAAFDFEITSTMAKSVHGSHRKASGNLAYHLIQSFSPDDNVSPEQAHELGLKLAMEFTDGKFEFIVATHINTASIHNHMITSY